MATSNVLLLPTASFCLLGFRECLTTYYLLLPSFTFQPSENVFLLPTYYILLSTFCLPGFWECLTTYYLLLLPPRLSGMSYYLLLTTYFFCLLGFWECLTTYFLLFTTFYFLTPMLLGMLYYLLLTKIGRAHV